jgi:hypothetical protein
MTCTDLLARPEVGTRWPLEEVFKRRAFTCLHPSQALHISTVTHLKHHTSQASHLIMFSFSSSQLDAIACVVLVVLLIMSPIIWPSPARTVEEELDAVEISGQLYLIYPNSPPEPVFKASKASIYNTSYDFNYEVRVAEITQAGRLLMAYDKLDEDQEIDEMGESLSFRDCLNFQIFVPQTGEKFLVWKDARYAQHWMFVGDSSTNSTNLAIAVEFIHVAWGFKKNREREEGLPSNFSCGLRMKSSVLMGVDTHERLLNFSQEESKYQ